MASSKSEEDKCSLTIAGIKVHFPKQKPFPSQIALMSKVIQALKTSENAIVESPTGTGKTLALLCSCLAWQQSHFQDQVKKRQKLVEQAENQENCELKHPQVTGESEGQIGALLHKGGKSDENSSESHDDDDDFIESKFFQSNSTGFSAAKNKKEKINMETACNANDKNSKKLPKIVIDKIFFVSRTHSQLVQALSELKKCPEELISSNKLNGNKLKVTLLGSRQQFCVNPAITKKKKFSYSAARDEECKRLLKHPGGCKCPYYLSGQNKLKRQAITKGIWDIEELNQIGRRVRGCPYFVARELMKSSHVIFCPYTYILNPVIRKSMGMDTFLKGSVVILDEAHNVESAVRDASSFEFSTQVLENAAAQLAQLCKNGNPSLHNSYTRLYEFLTTLCAWCKRVTLTGSNSTHWEGPLFLEILADQCQLTPATVVALRLCLDQAKKEGNSEESVETDNSPANDGDFLPNLCTNTLESIFTTLEYMFKEEQRYASDFHAAIIRKPEYDSVLKKQLLTSRLVVWCLRGAVGFSSFAATTRSVILSSGTLSPISSFAEELGTEFKHTLEAPHVINVTKSLWVGAISKSPGNVALDSTFRNVDSFVYHDELAKTLLSFLPVCPDGVLVFFPSYSALKKIIGRWKVTGTWKKIAATKTGVFIEGEGVSDTQKQLDGTMKDYLSCIDSGNGALFFCVFRGKLSEGIDFRDKAARAVFITGIPYPPLKDLKIKLKRQYQDNHSQGLNGSNWYSQQAWRALNQALGRVIRHRHDFGAVILLDQRFARAEISQYLSKWMRCTRKSYISPSDSLPSLQDFFNSHRISNESANNRKRDLLKCGGNLEKVDFFKKFRTNHTSVSSTLSRNMDQTDVVLKDNVKRILRNTIESLASINEAEKHQFVSKVIGNIEEILLAIN